MIPKRQKVVAYLFDKAFSTLKAVFYSLIVLFCRQSALATECVTVESAVVTQDSVERCVTHVW